MRRARSRAPRGSSAAACGGWAQLAVFPTPAPPPAGGRTGGPRKQGTSTRFPAGSTSTLRGVPKAPRRSLSSSRSPRRRAAGAAGRLEALEGAEPQASARHAQHRDRVIQERPREHPASTGMSSAVARRTEAAGLARISDPTRARSDLGEELVGAAPNPPPSPAGQWAIPTMIASSCRAVGRRSSMLELAPDGVLPSRTWHDPSPRPATRRCRAAGSSGARKASAVLDRRGRDQLARRSSVKAMRPLAASRARPPRRSRRRSPRRPPRRERRSACSCSAKRSRYSAAISAPPS